jgi:membrane fusion protein (multidrug efflux system)
VNRFQQALADKAVSQQDFDDADAALKQALADVAYWKAMVATARINLGYARVTSPISGRIGISSVTDGAIVTAYQPIPLTTIQQLDPIYVDVTQSANDLLRLQQRLKQGQLHSAGSSRVQLFLSDGTPYPLEGELQFRDVSVDPTTGSVTLRMVFPNPEGVLLPGMYVRAVVKEGAHEAALLIPQPAVMRDPKGNPYALVVNGEAKIEPRPLQLDRAVGDQWLVSDGLAVGERIVVEGLQKVRPGMAVKEVPLKAETPAANAAAGNAGTE